ncbi:uncharacterized protein LOC103309231 [Acyrthosiphon pisum]|uniref:DUF5641 domain-containing protein n=1 Tax=Acyrthosiphon pisum TaxID=7029 RepID=A0A8R2B5F0_ACYPI|nr:uncharacterized protein LOC103309231 [Acyrthosiphon pisum]|eukprot:XP_008182367.1 PREDICTED: uncharacterized protein LOC103309231 [Acyrthosiphon pisum]
MPNENNELAAFVLRRGQIKAQLTRFQTFLNEPKSEIKTQLRLRAEKIREAWSEFDAIQNNIEMLDVIKLKPLEIPTFSGKFEDWVTFQDIFCALVHTNKSITDIEKFCYLRNELEGEASSLIKNLETSSTNYEIAWKIITTRYNNTRMLIQTHTKRIFDLEPIIKESAIKLKNLTDSLNAHIQALKALKHDPYNWGALLLHVIYTKLDTNSIRQWEVEVLRDDLPSVQSMMEFLGKRCQMLESVENAKLLIFKQNDSNYSSTKTSKFGTSKKGASTFLTTYKMKCYLCQQPHPIYKCTVFLALDIPSRISKVNELKLCNNCLKKSDHQVKQCPARKCGKCQKLHNSLLHQEKEASSEEGNIQGNGSNDAVVVAHTVDAADTDNQVLLATAIIKISSSAGRNIHGRALLDNGSQSNFITNNLVHKLGLKRHKVNIPICGISESKNNIKYKVTAVVQSLNSSYVTTIEFLVLSKITGSLPHTPIRAVSIPDNVNVADPSFNCPGNIDVLIGGDTYWDIMCNEKLKTKDGPYLQNTLFGWVVVGKTSTQLSTTKLNSCLLTTQNQYQLLDNKIELFWKMEELSSKHNFTDEEKSCITHFNENLAQNEDGRFIVKLPFKENCHQLGNSYTSALRRFLSLEKRLIKNPELYMKYIMFMSEYENLNHMERVYDAGSDKQLIDSAKYFYLPHSYVINERSRTTKLRVVFDGSAKTSSGVSLNDTLMNGPKIQPDLLDIVVRFRTHKYAFSADITKMYRQVLVHEDHRDYQRVLWRSDPNDEVKVYRLCTVTYGLAPAGFLAISCINHLGDKTTNMKLKEIIKNDFCVDDCLTGADSLLEAIEVRNELISIMRGGGFELSKWTTNHTDLLPNHNKNEMTTVPMDRESVKTLGLYWEPKSDCYTYVVQVPEVKSEVTKRHILAGLATLFDPLGLVGPIILVGKILLQSLWREKIDWDSPVPHHIQLEWETYNNCLNELNSFSIPRWLGSNKNKQIEIHGFADASMKAYGACIYMRTIDTDGIVKSQLVCAKSRIAPVKVISIPRLELCAALLLSRLIDVIIPALNLSILRRYLWTDSTVTLDWISAESNRWKTFVANRVGEIHTLTDRAEWGHVTSSDNPADVLSRGCTPSELKYNTQWWHGPAWLESNTFKCSTSYVKNIEHVNDVQSEEKTALIVVCTSQKDVPLDINKYSSLTKLLHVVSYLLRFKNNALSKRNNTSHSVGPLNVNEVLMATKTIIKLIQHAHFSIEIEELKNNRNVSQKSKMNKLNPFIDDDGIVRVGGRLTNATDIDNDQRFPIILPYETTFLKLIMLHEHKKLMHAGPHATRLASVRMKYWPINGRRCVRKVIHQCVTCFKARPKSVSPIMGNLPMFRVDRPSRCFENCGVDYAGPFMLKCSNRRNAAAQKAYICVFICFATKAIHLELVCDLSTDAFLAALKRFISRRGLCKNIYSDNATCFIGANNTLNDLKLLMSSEGHKDRIHQFMTNHEITWHFIPPRAPHFGVQIEACLNSRPLTPLSTDPLDLSVLTPGHFLIGDSLVSLPEPDISNVAQNLLSRWKKVQNLVQQIWRRWSVEYLSQLQERKKWDKSRGPSVKVGSMVIVRDTNLPPLQWHLGRVIDVFPGKDGVVRVAMINTASGPKKRAVRLLCPLPIQDNDDTEPNDNN